MKDIIVNILMSGAGIGILLMVTARFIPNQKLDSWGENLGEMISGFGRSKLGKPYEKIETFMQNSILRFVKALIRGLDKDDAK